MEIIISSKREAQEWLRSISKGRDIQYVISITDPGEKPPRGFANHPAEKLSISFVDVEEDGGGYKAPRNADVMRIVKFCEKIVANPGKTLIHCYAGISRSTATAYTLLCMLRGPGKEKEAFDEVLKIRPIACPNMRVIDHADFILKREGAMFDAADRKMTELFPSYIRPEKV